MPVAREAVRVGVIGCGMMAEHYVEEAAAFGSWRAVVCADSDAGAADSFGGAYRLPVLCVDELLESQDVELVLNLTPPAAHATLTAAALAAGKHVYSEAPLALSATEGRELVAEADRRGLRLGCAPDTFVGSAYTAGRALIEAGEIGEPIGAAAAMLVGGPDTWHPNADMFFGPGGGPLFDLAQYYLAALIDFFGPVVATAGIGATMTPERTLGAGPRAGETFRVVVPTHVAAVLEHESGLIATLTASYEARGQYVAGLDVYGSVGMLRLPDAHSFGGELFLSRGRAQPQSVAYQSNRARETRGLGLHDLVEAMHEGRPHRANGEIALRVLAAAEGIGDAAQARRFVTPS